MHFIKHIFYVLLDTLCNLNINTMLYLSIIQCALCNCTIQHFFQTHGLCSYLQDIRIMIFWFSSFIFYR